MSDIHPYTKGYQVRTDMTVHTNDPITAAQMVYALHHEMTPQDYMVADGEGKPVKVALTQEQKDEALRKHRAGEYFQTTSLKD